MSPSEGAAEGGSRTALLHPRFIGDMRFWAEADPRTNVRLLRLVEEIVRDPFHGIGKPEPLRRLAGTWSRRLTDEHRVTYRVTADTIEFLAARHHYR